MRTVSAEASVAPVVARAVASLPVSLTWATESAELHAVEGAAGWPGRVVRAARSGALGVLVVHPVAISQTELRSLRQGLEHTSLVLEWTYASNPAVEQLAGWRPASQGLLECTAMAPLGADTGRELLEVAAWLHAAFAATPTPTSVRRWTDGAQVSGPIRLRGTDGIGITRVIHTDAVTPRLEITWADGEQRLAAEFFAPDTARPATITLTDSDGDRTLPSQFEDGHRTSWKRLLHEVDVNRPASACLDSLLETLEAITPAAEPVRSRHER